MALATCSRLPDLDEDEGLVIPALAGYGVDAAARVWDDPSVVWDDFDVVVVRSTWDYAERRAEFLRWSESLPFVLNGPEVLRWNTDKVYLRELAGRGIAVVPTVWIEAGAPHDAALPSGGDDIALSAGGGDITLPSGEVVVKPVVSAGARHTARHRAEDEVHARAHVQRLLAAGRAVMVQPYVASVDSDGETGVIHLGGEYSHSIRKGPLLEEPGAASDRLWKEETISGRLPGADELRLAEATLDALPWPRGNLLYSRVDIVRDGDGAPMVLEVELAEPSLFLGHGDRAAERLATAIVQRLER